MSVLGSEQIHYADSGLGGSEVMPVAAFQAFAAVGAAELVVLDIVVANAYRGLDVPVARQHPLVSARNARSGKPSLVARVLQSVQDAQGELHFAHVELASHEMEAVEPAVEALARPETELGLHHPVAYLLLARELPRVKAVEKLHSIIACDGGLHSEVDGGGGPVQEISLDADLLCPHGQREHK